MYSFPDQDELCRSISAEIRERYREDLAPKESALQAANAEVERQEELIGYRRLKLEGAVEELEGHKSKLQEIEDLRRSHPQRLAHLQSELREAKERNSAHQSEYSELEYRIKVVETKINGLSEPRDETNYAQRRAEYEAQLASYTRQLDDATSRRDRLEREAKQAKKVYEREVSRFSNADWAAMAADDPVAAQAKQTQARFNVDDLKEDLRRAADGYLDAADNVENLRSARNALAEPQPNARFENELAAYRSEMADLRSTLNELGAQLERLGARDLYQGAEDEAREELEACRTEPERLDADESRYTEKLAEAEAAVPGLRSAATDRSVLDAAEDSAAEARRQLHEVEEAVAATTERHLENFRGDELSTSGYLRDLSTLSSRRDDLNARWEDVAREYVQEEWDHFESPQDRRIESLRSALSEVESRRESLEPKKQSIIRGLKEAHVSDPEEHLSTKHILSLNSGSGDGSDCFPATIPYQEAHSGFRIFLGGTSYFLKYIAAVYVFCGFLTLTGIIRDEDPEATPIITFVSVVLFFLFSRFHRSTFTDRTIVLDENDLAPDLAASLREYRALVTEQERTSARIRSELTELESQRAAHRKQGLSDANAKYNALAATKPFPTDEVPQLEKFCGELVDRFSSADPDSRADTAAEPFDLDLFRASKPADANADLVNVWNRWKQTVTASGMDDSIVAADRPLPDTVAHAMR